MQTINVVVTDKQVSLADPKTRAVCGNTDYVISFMFDEEE